MTSSKALKYPNLTIMKAKVSSKSALQGMDGNDGFLDNIVVNFIRFFNELIYFRYTVYNLKLISFICLIKIKLIM